MRLHKRLLHTALRIVAQGTWLSAGGQVLPTAARLELGALTGITSYVPGDLTLTARAATTLEELNTAAAENGQWCPLLPWGDDSASVGAVFATGTSGPFARTLGRPRDVALGMEFVDGTGATVRAGGKVVKNVAGYDLAKLFIGARGSLGVIVEATFKLRPWPELERIVGLRASDLAEAQAVLRAVLDSPLTPVILDAHRSTDSAVCAPIEIILGCAGTREEVEWQLNTARTLGFESDATLEYETQFWSEPAPVHRLSVLPSRLTEAIAEVGSRPFVAREGNGVIYFRGDAVARKEQLPVELMHRLKHAYDP